MTLSLHDEARRRFDFLADGVLALTKPGEPPRRGRAGPPPRDERDIRTFASSDIVPGSLRMSLVDFRGRRSGLYFEARSTHYAVEGQAMELFEQLVALLGRKRQLRQAVGPRFLSEALEDWLKGRLEGAVTQGFSDFILAKANASLQPRTVVVPLENFRSESPFDFAGVHFDHLVMTRAMFDQVEREGTAAQPDQEGAIRSAVERYRRSFQGQTCGVVAREADPRWAANGATESVDRAMAAIRLFSPAALAPGHKSAIGRVGRVFVPGNVTCEIVDGLPALFTDGCSEGYEQVQWLWRDEARMLALGAGLADFERLLLKDDPTEFEEAVLRAVVLLDESVCCNALHKRTALAFTAAESLLIRDTSEYVQVMLGLRCGRLTQEDPDERLRVDRTIKKGYALRSGYLHHGGEEVDEETLGELHIVFLDAFAAAARLTARLSTRQELFEFLERLIWS